jgi:hypothetical protein
MKSNAETGNFAKVCMRCPLSLLFPIAGWVLPLLALSSPGLLTAQPAPVRTAVLNAALPVHDLGFPLLLVEPGGVTTYPAGEPIRSSLFSTAGSLFLLDTARFRRAHPTATHLKVAFRASRYPLSATYFLLDTAALRKARRQGDIAYDFSPYQNPDTWKNKDLQTNGTYTRGLSVGNSQNLAFNSNLNLQLSGKLGNDLEVAGTISDNSIPLQPDGTTRQLREFDQIFLQVKQRNTTFTAGDFDLLKPETGYFSRYFKRLQGAMIHLSNNHADSLSSRLALAVSKGKFNRQLIQGAEGNQGPYRLQGAEGERYIIVLAGTEQVFADGQRMQRGLTDDYTIDYNLGEITFTARRLITKDVRIVVEFEYATQNYLRTTVASHTRWVHQKQTLYLSLYSEQDGRNGQNQTPAQRQALAAAGDRIGETFLSGIDTLPAFQTDRVQYRYQDTLACGNPARVLAFSTDPSTARYTAIFTEVGEGRGNYRVVPGNANGRVFEWVAPDPLTCTPTGQFEPVVKLVAPEQRQLFALGSIHRTRHGSVGGEIALSNRDYNRLSPAEDNHNTGLGGNLQFTQQWPLPKKGWTITSTGLYEYAAARFQPLNPYRAPEFSRDWNVQPISDTRTEQTAHFQVTARSPNQQLGYSLHHFSRYHTYRGFKNMATATLRRKTLQLQATWNQLSNTTPSETARFSRPKFDFSHTPKNNRYQTGIYFEREQNNRSDTQADTLLRTSFWYDLWKIYLTSPQKNQNWAFGAYASQRTDFLPGKQDFSVLARATDLNVRGNWQSRSTPNNQSLGWTLTYRTLAVDEQAPASLTSQNTYLGRIDYSLQTLKNAVSLTTGYEISSGQSPKLNFNYLPVNPGEGQYAWIDRNRDSILQLDEMEVALFRDQANYVRVAVTSTDYIRTNNLSFNQQVRFEPRVLWRNKTDWRKYLARTSTQSTWTIHRRTFADALPAQAWNPYFQNIPEAGLASLQTILRHALFLNRANPRWDASLTYHDQSNQYLLVSGFERRKNRDWATHLRWAPIDHWSLEADRSFGNRAAGNQTFNSRNFNIGYVYTASTIQWIPSPTLRLKTVASLKHSTNTSEWMENARQKSLQIEGQWNLKSTTLPSAGVFSLRATYTDILYTGAPNTAVAYTMLEGLQPGKNVVWSLQLDRPLTRSLQITIAYEGRKTGDNRLVHLARAQARAIF